MRRPVYNTCSCPPVGPENTVDARLNRDVPAAIARKQGKRGKQTIHEFRFDMKIDLFMIAAAYNARR